MTRGSQSIDAAAGGCNCIGGSCCAFISSAASLTSRAARRPPPARNFQDALGIGLHDVFVADPDNRIIFHARSPSCPGPEDQVSMSRIVAREKLPNADWFIAR
jgi:hypothetical protein